jgi:DNA helicase-2/ATP-dependent DNA helicase PcrA
MLIDNSDCHIPTFETLNKEQSTASSTSDGYIRLIAGAGTGKTRTLTYRYAYLVKKLGISPSEILNVTFTNKAANEMKDRIKKLIDFCSDDYICTFHSFCNLFLRKEIDEIGFPKFFTILDESDQKDILKEIYKELDISSKKYNFSGMIDKIEDIKNKNKDIYVEYLIGIRDFSKISLELDEYVGIQVIKKYLEKQKQTHCLDFDDLLHFTLYILNKYDDIRNRWQMRYVQVDEFQDTNREQFELVKLISEGYKNLFVVGDPDQLIYSWRGAMNYILSFSEEFDNVKTLYLSHNYRSSKRIIETANSLISNNKKRIKKELISLQGEGNFPIYYGACNGGDEADWVVDRIQEIKKSNVSNLEQIAVMYRANYVSMEIEERLRKEGIPYIIYNGVSFYSRWEIKDTIAYLKLLLKDDDNAFLRIVNTPSRGIGDKKIEIIKNYAIENDVSLYQSLKDNFQNVFFKSVPIKEFIDIIEKFRVDIKTEKIGYIIDSLMESIGYIKMIKKIESVNGFEDKTNKNSRVENIEEFKTSLINMYSDENFNLDKHLQELTLNSDKERKNSSGCVRLMTIHSAKGLEFENVFVCGLSEGIFPSNRSAEDEDKIEEERRVAFVAITRAKNNLLLSSRNVSFNGYCEPSRFIKEISGTVIGWKEY